MPITVSTAFKDGLRGPVDISGFKVQVNFVGAIWVDLTDLVEGTIRGRMEESPVGGNFSSNYAFVTFNNDDGAFSPLNTSSPYYNYLTPNKPIVIDVLVNGESCRIFTGVTGAWPPQARSRQVTIKCYDKARIWAKSDILEELVYNEANPGTGLSWNRVFERAAWLAGLRWDYVQTYDTSGTYAATSQLNPDGSTTAITVASGATTTATYRQGGAGGTIVMKVDIARSAAGAILMLKATNVSGKVLKVLSDLAMVVDGRIYFDQQGILRVRSRMYVADPAFTETITIDDLDDCQFTQNYEGSAYPLYNSAKIQAKPLSFRVDASLALVEEPVSFLGDKFPYREFSGGQTFPGATDGQQFASLPDGIFILKTTGYPTADKFRIRSALKDDLLNDLGANGITWAAGYPKFGTNRVELKLTNNNAKTAVLTELTLNAKLAAPRVVITAKHKDQTSIDQYGQTDFNYQNDFIPDNLAAENLAKWVITSCKDVKPVVTLPLCYATPWTELGDCWRVSETTASIIPTPTDMVIRAFEFALGKDSYTITPEVVPPAPAFVLQTATGSITETSNAAAGAKGDEVPYTAVAGVGKQVGLNSLKAFTEITQTTREAINTSVTSGYTHGVLYKGLLYVLDNAGGLSQIDPRTLSTLNRWTILAGGGVLTGASIKFETDGVTSYLYFLGKTVPPLAVKWRLYWFDLDNPGTWGIKSVLTDLTPNNITDPYDVKVIGTECYITGRSAPSGSGGVARLMVIDVTNTATSTSVADVKDLTTSAASARGLTHIGGDVWVASSEDSSTDALSANVAAGATTAVVTNASTAAAMNGRYVRFKNNTTNKTEIVKVTGVSGTTLTVSPALTNAYSSGDAVRYSSNWLSKYNIAGRTFATTAVPNDGYAVYGLEYDGRDLWAAFGARVVRYNILSGSPVKASEIAIPGISYSAAIRYDGTYLWAVVAKSIFQMDPRLNAMVAAFSTTATTADGLIFDGRDIFAPSSNGTYVTLYVVPRWSSVAN